jgi:hypothetical protein
VIELPYEIERASKEARAHYLKLIAAGQTERFAIMCALMQAPGTKASDRAFMEGRYSGNWLDELPKRQAKWLVAEAKAAGINPSGKFYMSGLADKRGHLDPMAWVDSVDDIKKVAKARNLNVQGIVNIEAKSQDRKEVALNPRVEKELARKEIARNPGLSYKDAVAAVRQKHAPRWKRKKLQG